MFGVLLAPPAVLGELEFSFGGLGVFARPIIVALAVRALKSNKFVLCHMGIVTILYSLLSSFEPERGIEPPTYSFAFTSVFHIAEG